jgi:hypothetical protein
MRHPIPPIPSAVAALKARLQHAQDSHKKPRLQMLYLLASGQARPRQDVARLLGVIATPLAIGWPSMPPEGWPPCWRPRSPQSHQTRLRPSQHARPPVRHISSGRSPRRTPAPCGSVATTNAASAC